MHYQQFDYFTSGKDDELCDAMLPIPTHQPPSGEPDVSDEQNLEPGAQDPVSDESSSECLPQLFSEHEPVRSPSLLVTISDPAHQ